MPEIRPFHALLADLAGEGGAPGRRGWVRDPAPAIFQLRQTFEHDGATRSRRGLVAALYLPASGPPALLPHEPADPREVRLRFEQLATSRTFSRPLLVLYPGDLGDVESALALERERRPDARAGDAAAG